MANSRLRRVVDNAILSHLSSAASKPSTSVEDKKTRHKLKKFLIRRPTYQAVRDKGYIKGFTQSLTLYTTHIVLTLFLCILKKLKVESIYICRVNMFFMTTLL